MKSISTDRLVPALLAALVSGWSGAQTVNVVEYRNKALDAYFITGRASEQALLDTVADFSRTGMTFQATSAASAAGTLTRICRFYVNVTNPFVNSHFYGRQGVDCESLLAAQPAGFNYEGYDFALPTPSAGTCPAGTTTVYRSFRALASGKTSNHRYTVSATTYTSAATAGYVGEGAAFCATAATDAGVAPSATAVGTATGSALSATMGAAGGSLSSADGKLTVTVPPNALAANTAIGIQPISNFAHGKIGSAYRLTPNGQTFAKPVILTFGYTDADLIGTAVDTLGAAFQTATGFWQWIGDATVNAPAKTFSVSTTHFSDWSKVKGIQLRPASKVVRVKGSVSLQVAICYPVSITAPSGDELATLGYNCEPDNDLPLLNPVRDWSVNGVLGGSSSTGTVTGSGTTGTYVAPAAKPSPATVAVSARVDRSSRSPVQVVSNITISDDSWTGTATGTFSTAQIGESSTASVTWILSSVDNNIAVYRPSGSVIAAFTTLVGCADTPTLDPSSHTLNPTTDGILTIDYNSTPPTYHGSGLSSWPATLTCTDTSGVRGSIPGYEGEVDFFGGSGGALGIEAAGKVSADGMTIEGGDARAVGTLGQQTFRWKFTRNP